MSDILEQVLGTSGLSVFFGGGVSAEIRGVVYDGMICTHKGYGNGNNDTLRAVEIVFVRRRLARPGQCLFTKTSIDT
jgi:hypothetical protein